MNQVVRHNVLVIPARAVDAAGWLRLGNGSRRQVELGLRDDGYVEVLSGLEDGDRVLLPE